MGSNGGFYGCGIYCSESLSYGLGSGRYAYRVPGFQGMRMMLIVAKVITGRVQDFGSRVDAATESMRMPGFPFDDDRSPRYDTVRGGPHRPWMSGPGTDASVIYVAYESNLVYPAYI